MSIVRISSGKYKDLWCTAVSYPYLDDDLGNTNGCGSGWLSRKLLRGFQAFTGAHVSEVCDLHDLVYSIPYELRTSEHKKAEDTCFEKNLEYILTTEGGWQVPNWLWGFSWYRQLDYTLVRALPDLYHIAVTAKGDKAYWSV